MLLFIHGGLAFLDAIYLKKLVIALGGNAILQFDQKGSNEDQIANMNKTSQQLAPVIASWYQVVITHGNGPQVGNILIQNESAKDKVPAMPLDVCGAESQGQIGYLLNQTLSNQMKNLGKNPEICTLMTQVLVDSLDEAFKNPTKPIGPWLDYRTMVNTKKEGEKWVEDAERGWRKTVPSPKPIKILNSRAIETLINSGVIVIACGGGGVPVIESEQGKRCGIEAVIDKDLASACLASEIRAHILLILTDVRSLFLNFGREDQRSINQISVNELKNYFEQKMFAAGSMGPKVEAAIQFVERGGERAVIARLDELEDALKGRTGTTVVQ
jgi:carbamate kinase